MALLLGLGFLCLSQAGTVRAADFVQARGNKLFLGQQELTLRSVSFSNFYRFSIGEEGFHPEVSSHHAESDFARVKSLGFNSIRFALNGNWYETDPEGFWRWLDQNIDWAEKHGVLLTLDMHVPIGGFWLAPTSPQTDFRIWTDPEIRRKNVDLWRAIAERYRERTIIAGYELLNEAVTEDKTGQQYKDLVNDLVLAIRAVDPNHLLIVGMLYGTDRQYGDLTRDSQFRVDDANVLYDFHFYEPVSFTHQNASWLAQPVSDGGQYPDMSRIAPTGTQRLLPDSQMRSRHLETGTSGWTEYRSGWRRLKDPRATAGIPILSMRGDVSGIARFINIRVEEYDRATRRISTLVTDPISPETAADWWAWGSTEDDAGHARPGRADNPETGLAALGLAIESPGARQFYSGWSSDRHWFRATPGNYYRIMGQMRGTDITYGGPGSNGYAGLEIDFYTGSFGGKTAAFLLRDKGYLEHEIAKLMAFGARHNVPVSAMEFGTMHQTFSDPGGSGSNWVGDMLDIFSNHQISFSLWNYHGPEMGIFLSDYPDPPENPNQPLIDTLRKSLTASTPLNSSH